MLFLPAETGTGIRRRLLLASKVEKSWRVPSKSFSNDAQWSCMLASSECRPLRGDVGLELFADMFVTIDGDGTASWDERPLWNSWGVVGALDFRFQNGLFSGAGGALE